MILFDRRAQLGEQVMMFAFMFLLLVVGAGIVLGTSFFIGSGADFRKGHATLLGYKLEECAGRGFDFEVLEGTGEARVETLAKSCGLNAEVLKNYFRVRICRGSNLEKDCLDAANSLISYGDVTPCGFTENEEKKFLGCAFTSVSSGYTIVTATNQKARRRA